MISILTRLYPPFPIFLQRLAVPLCVFKRVRTLDTVAGVVGCRDDANGVMMLVAGVMALTEVIAARGRTDDANRDLSILISI